MKAKYDRIPSLIDRKYKRDYIVKAESVLGKALPLRAEVHHHSEVELVICENKIYHRLLHDRTNALRTCGHANWRKCTFCKQYNDPKNLVFSTIKTYHKHCNAKYMREYRRKDPLCT